MSLKLKWTRIPAAPAPVKFLFRPLLFLALGFHAFVLFMPLTQEKKEKPKEKPKEEQVKITQLKTSLPPKPPKPKLPKARVDRPKPPVPPPPQPPEQPQGTQSDAGKNPFKDFPHFPGAAEQCPNPGFSPESCRTASAPLAAVASHFQKQDGKNNWKFTAEEGDATKQYFRVTKGTGKDAISGYLSLLVDGSTTVYVLSGQKIPDIATFKKAEGIPGEVQGILDAAAPADSDVAANDVGPNDFSNPDSFYVGWNGLAPEQHPAIFGAPKVLVDQSRLDAFLSKSFDAPPTPAGAYGGGQLLEVKKGGKSYFVNLVPGTTGGTIVVVWTQRPG